jgi:hypothetical protein
MRDEIVEGHLAEATDLRTITPDLPKHVLVKLSAFIEVKRHQKNDKLGPALRRLHDLWQDEAWSLELRAVALLLADLLDQGWHVFADDNAIHLQPPGLRLAGETPESVHHEVGPRMAQDSIRSRHPEPASAPPDWLAWQSQ